jgi:hypothetical protein
LQHQSKECQPLELDFYGAPTLNGTHALATEAIAEHQADEQAPDQPDVSVVATEEQKESIREEDETLK